MPSSPPCSHSTIEDRSNRIAADIETNEAFPDRKTNPAVFDKLEGCNPKWPRIRSPKSTRGQENKARALYKKKSIPGVVS